ncbi:hypothetical protein [Clostridium beijerinckii]|uniref:Uncharacterized protein n=1 Tax=Clostridium beijerinckii TaxID=1520 RepID=A0AAX0B7S0_CLOBE|nr:hypothetical protein [Clostridium beijerinckii]NRT91273.1 hypothetical protein [Clostridium beijerinckii]NYC70799.1 hypothetical protein [Clostridium beijerinckii]
MEEEKRKLKTTKSGEIVNRWITIILITYLPISFAISHLIKLFMVTDIYEYYYVFLIGDLLWGPGFVLFLLGLIINELIYFSRCKENKKIIVLIFLLCCICSITYKWVPNSEFYKEYKDFYYVMKNTYCEEIQELKNVDIHVITGKWSSKTLYVETSDFKFIVQDNIVAESDYDSFKFKYNNVKKVKIKYLPNSNLLLRIEPMKD